ncbi:MAG: ParB/RepB/Spo0J family partition protein [Oscillibacter sp.]|jgi:ParB family chromosome partitioning protein|nr:ParB/RepB/Spo0J family partition protein [Oscillibacter sp.]
MEKQPPSRREVLQLPVEELVPNPMQPRRVFDADALRSLADSIRQHGILQPLTVRRSELGWELVAGERRLRAAKMAGLSTVPCLAAEVSDSDSALLALLENLQRQDLHYLEEAEALAAFVRKTGISQEALAAKLGRSPSAVANKLRLLRLSPECASVLLNNRLSERHARALLRLESEDERRAVLRHVVAAGLNVAQTEAYIDQRLRTIQQTRARMRRTYVIKDVRLFLNSVDRGLRLIRDAGVAAESGREETDDAILLTIRIPKQNRT